MTQLQKTYEKYRDEFEKLEKLTKPLYPGNPFQYEQQLAMSVGIDDYYPRSGKVPYRTPVYDKEGNLRGFKAEEKIAPPERKKKIDAYWEQRDKVDELLRKDEQFQKLVDSKNYETAGNGLDAFFWISYFAIKHKIYPLSEE